MGLFSKVGSFIKENAHTILDVAGMIPGIGAVADLANAGLYAAEGDWVNAGLSAVSAIPGVGDTIALANKGMKVAKGAKAILKGGKGVKTLLKAGGKSIAKAVKGKMKVGGRLLKKLNPKSLYKSFKDKMKHVCLFGKCFTGDTLVYTEKGYVPISEIKVGDLVFSRDETTGEMGYKRVEQIFQTESHTIHIIEVNGSTVIRTTAYHRFYVEERGWVSAINLKEGDCLSTSEGQAFITGVEKARFEEPVIMYNFHVEDWVSYFVSEIKLFVHNGIGGHEELTQIIAGKNFKKHFIDHKHLLERVTGNKYNSYKNPETFLSDIGKIIDDGIVDFVGKGTLNKTSDVLNIYRGSGITVGIKESGEWVTILQSGSGMDLNILFK